MKLARVAVLGVALVAGGVAAMLAGGSRQAPPAPRPAEPVRLASTEVLTAKGDIPMGKVIAAGDLTWIAWPKDGASNYITRDGQPGAVEDVTGAIARQPFVTGEPIRTQKIIKANGSGFMSAILPAGMRAVATEISAETGAGGFILPNDRVDVILTRRGNGDKEEASSSTILTDVRVLAIDQSIEDKNGNKVVVGRTATLELLPPQVETLALARQSGTLSLALRSLVDSNRDNAGPQSTTAGPAGSFTVVRYGVATQSSQR